MGQELKDRVLQTVYLPGTEGRCNSERYRSHTPISHTKFELNTLQHLIVL